MENDTAPVNAEETDTSVTESTNLYSFENVLHRLRRGAKATRRGWNGKGLWIQIQFPNAQSKMTRPYIYLRTAGEVGDLVPWFPSQTDLLMNDWEIVE